MKGNFKIFIVEDDKWYSQLLEYHLNLNPDYEVRTFHNGKDFLNALHEKPNVVTLDYGLPDMTGDELLSKVKDFDPNISCIIISGQEDVKTAIGLLKRGAYDYLIKDEDTNDRLWNSINNIREKSTLKEEITYLKKEVGQKYDFSNIMKGQSDAIKRVFSLMEKTRNSNITVSITGETGTGKELVAKAVHYNSVRKNNPFIAVNVAAIPADLLESELFGHEKGAFTGAHTRRIGKFEEAHKGTLFLDEIGELELPLQAKLLRVLQEREVTRIGGNKPIKIDIRIVVATHRNLAEEVKAGRFREDLYFRLLGLPIHLPPLRERGNDVLILAKYFVDEFCKDNKLPKLSLSKEAQEKLKRYPFPGNIRELKAIMELASVMTNNEQIDSEDITINSSDSIDDLLLEEITLKEYTEKIIHHFLKKYDDNVLLVADKLGIGKSTIYRLLKKEEESNT